MAEAGLDCVTDNCLKILQNPTHQNGLKFSTFLNIYRGKFGNAFPTIDNLDDFFTTFATVTCRWNELKVSVALSSK